MRKALDELRRKAAIRLSAWLVLLALAGCAYTEPPPSSTPETGPWRERLEARQARLAEQARAASNSPCEDSLFVALGKRDLDSLSEREYAYFLEMQRQCGAWNQAAHTSNAGSGQSAWGVVGIVLTLLIGIGLVAGNS